MKKVIAAMFLFLVIGCGTEAPFDAQVQGPTDSSVTLFASVGGSYSFSGPLMFKVLNAAGDKPLPGVDIEFFSDGTLTDSVGGSALGTGSYFKTKTDDQGVARVFVKKTFPACDAAADVTYTASVDAVAGPAAAGWIGSVVVSQC
jgi:hypothetical protein